MGLWLPHDSHMIIRGVSAFFRDVDEYTKVKVESRDKYISEMISISLYIC